MQYELKIQENVHCKQHRYIFIKTIQSLKESERLQFLTFMINTYKKYSNEKNIMRNKKIKLDDFFKNKNSNRKKNFEKFNDSVYKAIFDTKVDQYIHRVFSSKYKRLISDEVISIVGLLIQHGVTKSDFQKYFGRKVSSFLNPEDLFKSLEVFLEHIFIWERKKIFKNNHLLSIVEGVDYTIEYDHDNILILNILSFKASSTFGSHMWCIQRDEEIYQDYTSDGDFFKFYFDFNIKSNDQMSLLALVSDIKNELSSVFDKSDCNMLNNFYPDENMKDFDDFKYDNEDDKTRHLHILKIKSLLKKESELEQNVLFLKKAALHEYYYDELFFNVDKNFFSIKNITLLNILFKINNDFNIPIDKKLLEQCGVNDLDSIEGDYFYFHRSSIFKNYFFNNREYNHNCFYNKSNPKVNDNLINFLEQHLWEYTNYIEDVCIKLLNHCSVKGFALLLNLYKEETLSFIKRLNEQEFSALINKNNRIFNYNNITCFFKDLNNEIDFNFIEECGFTEKQLLKIYSFVDLTSSKNSFINIGFSNGLENENFNYPIDDILDFSKLNEFFDLKIETKNLTLDIEDITPDFFFFYEQKNSNHIDKKDLILLNEKKDVYMFKYKSKCMINKIFKNINFIDFNNSNNKIIEDIIKTVINTFYIAPVNVENYFNEYYSLNGINEIEIKDKNKQIFSKIKDENHLEVSFNLVLIKKIKRIMQKGGDKLVKELTPIINRYFENSIVDRLFKTTEKRDFDDLFHEYFDFKILFGISICYSVFKERCEKYKDQNIHVYSYNSDSKLANILLDYVSESLFFNQKEKV